MKRQLLALLALGVLITITPSLAQQGISISKVDTNNFPTMRAKLSVRGSDGSSIRSFNPGDIQVFENGVARTVTDITCPPQTAESPACVVLVSDKSLSMADRYSNDLSAIKMDLVKLGATTFINTLNFTPPTQVAMVAFDSKAYLFQNFTGNPVEIQGAIDDLSPAFHVGTNYEAAFMQPGVGALEIIKKCPNIPGMRRIVIFLTDGACVVPGVDPEDCFRAQPVIDTAQKYGAEIFVIGLGSNSIIDDSLQRVADETGGISFDRKITEGDIRAVYREIAENIQGLEPCTITWESAYGCGEDSRRRATEVRYTPGPDTTKIIYDAGPNSIARNFISPTVLSYGNPAIGDPQLQTFRIEVENAPYTLNAIALGLPDAGYFRIVRIIHNGVDVDPLNDLPRQIQPGDNVQVEVEFTQANGKDFRLAEVQMATVPCNVAKVVVWGGGAADNSTYAKVFPDGGEFSACDSVLITWVVTPQNRPVTLSYSEDGGASFTDIVSNLSGSEYKWLPPGTGNNYVVRVEAYGSFADWDWALAEGGSGGVDSTIAVDTDPDGNTLVVGSYTGSADFSGTGLSGGGHFLARYDTDGQLLWAQKNQAIIIGEEPSGTQTLDIVDAASHSDGFSYLVGSKVVRRVNPNTGQGAPNRGRRLTNPDDLPATFTCVAVNNSGNAFAAGIGVSTVDNQKTSFVNQYDNALAPLWNFRDVSNRLVVVNASITDIAVDINNDIIVTGEVDFGGTTIGSANLPRGNYMAKFRSSDRTPVWAVPLPGSRAAGNMMVNDIAVDADRNIYLTGAYESAPLKFGTLPQLGTVGNGDFFVVKYNPDGISQWATRAASLPTSSRERGTGIDVDLNGSVYISGSFQSKSMAFENAGGAIGGELRRPDRSGEVNDLFDVFVVKYNTDGTVQWVQNGGGNRNDYGSAIAVDRSGMAYVGGLVAARTNAGVGNGMFGNFNLVNTGQGDVFISKVRGYPERSDTSDIAFTVRAPVISTASNPINVGQAPLGQQVEFSANFELLNLGSVVLDVTDHEIIGTPGEFVTDLPDLDLDPDAPPISIPPGDNTSFFISFTPSAIGIRTATLRIFGACAEIYEVELRGEGLDPCDATVVEEHTIPPAPIGSGTPVTIDDIFCNTTGRELTIDIRYSGPGAAYYDAPPGMVTLQPGDCYDLNLVFTPDAIDIPDLIITYGIGVCPYVTTVHGSGLAGTATIQATPPVPVRLICPGALPHVFPVNLRNVGATELRIDAITVEPPTAGITVGGFPASLATNESGEIILEFNSRDYGADKIVNLRLQSNADNTDETIEVHARIDTIWFEYVPPTMNFGANSAGAFPVTGTVEIFNRGTTTVDVDDQILPAGVFTVTNPAPHTLAPGESFTVDIRFDDPGNDILQSEIMVLDYTPACEPAGLTVTGIRANAGVTINLPAGAVADVHAKNYAIPVRLTPGVNYGVLVEESRRFSFTLRVDPDVYLPTGVSGGSCVGCTITDNAIRPDASNVDKRTVVIEGTAPAGSDNGPQELFFNILGDVLLGDVEQSALEMEVTWSGVGVTPQNGDLTLEGICREGGNRLLSRGTGAFGIVSISPNPAGDVVEIGLSALEIGLHTLDIYNSQGQRVYRYEWAHTFDGGNSTAAAQTQFLLPVSTAHLANGIYQLVLKTPTQAGSEHLIIAR